jgi:hypothetical protein
LGVSVIQQSAAIKRKAVTLFLAESIYEKYREYCDRNGLIPSKRFERFMEGELASPDFATLDLRLRRKLGRLLR